ncbi:MAG: hypothetical protein ACTSRG_19060 [Candidatus Helarchaeota archaeon]
MVRPLKYLLVKEYEQTPPPELATLPLNAIAGIVSDDVGSFEAMGITSILELSEAEFSKLKGKELSDYKVNRGILYAIDIMIQSIEPGVYEEIMPIDELLDRKYELTPPNKLNTLPTVAIEGVAPRGEAKLKEIGIKTIKELASSDIKKIKTADIYDWEAEKYLEYAKWIMKYAEENIKKPKMDNIEVELKGDKLFLKFDSTKEFGPSSTGKTIIVATSHGGKRIQGSDLSFGLFAYKYPTKKKTKAKIPKPMQNVDVTINGNIVTLQIDTTKDFGSSASGKSSIVASSRGNKQIENTGIFIGLNVYKQKKN